MSHFFRHSCRRKGIRKTADHTVHAGLHFVFFAGLIGNVHKGRDGYRDVYVNDIGKEALTGTAPYNFPAGSIVIKEQFANKAAWEAQKGGEVTVSLKVKDGTGSADNWEWAAGYTGKAGPSQFCAGCHTAAIASDFVFTHEDFLAKEFN